MSTRERSIQSRTVEVILAAFPKAWVRVKHGTQFGKVGDPDVYGCVNSWFFGFEIKNENGKLSRIQKHVLEELHRSGAIHGAIGEPDDAVHLIRYAFGR